MVTSVDSNIFFDITSGDVLANLDAVRALKAAAISGSVLISMVCYAELAFRFPSPESLGKFLDQFEVRITPLDLTTAYLAGKFMAEYRQRGGTRTRILADFLIAAHAQLHSDRLLTRDDRFFSNSFPNLKAVTPDQL
jgi:predicted nucleic acid-binding protein